MILIIIPHSETSKYEKLPIEYWKEILNFLKKVVFLLKYKLKLNCFIKPNEIEN